MVMDHPATVYMIYGLRMFLPDSQLPLPDRNCWFMVARKPFLWEAGFLRGHVTSSWLDELMTLI